MTRTILLFPFLAALAACTSQGMLNKKFPNLSSEKEEITTINVVTDVLLVSDIDGTVDGVYEDAVRHLSPIIGTKIKQALHEKNFIVPELYVNTGIIGNKFPELHYASNDKSTGVKLTYPMFQANGFETLETLENRLFYKNIMEAARSVSIKKPNVKIQIPEEWRSEDGEAILVVFVQARDVSTEKSLSVGLLTALPGALLSPAFVYSVFPVSGAQIEAALVELRNGKVLWHNTVLLDGGSSGKVLVQPALTKLMKTFPKRVSPQEMDVVETDNLAMFSQSNSLEVQSDLLEQATSLNALRVKYQNKDIDKERYKLELQRLKGTHSHKMNSLKKRLRSGEINRLDYDVFALKEKWSYQGEIPVEEQQKDFSDLILNFKIEREINSQHELYKWNLLSLNNSLESNAISSKEFDDLEEKLENEYSIKMRELKLRLKQRQIGKAEFDIEKLVLSWKYKGIAE